MTGAEKPLPPQPVKTTMIRLSAPKSASSGNQPTMHDPSRIPTSGQQHQISNVMANNGSKLDAKGMLRQMKI